MTSQTRERWLSLIRLFQRSSLSLRDFAKQQGLNPRTFRNYYYRLRQLCQDAQPDIEFLPVVVDHGERLPSPELGRVTVRVAEAVSVEFEGLPPPHYLAQLIGALGSR